jgi:hypothetical protein
MAAGLICIAGFAVGNCVEIGIVFWEWNAMGKIHRCGDRNVVKKEKRGILRWLFQKESCQTDVVWCNSRFTWPGA